MSWCPSQYAQKNAKKPVQLNQQHENSHIFKKEGNFLYR